MEFEIFTTAKAFNAASKEFDWGYVIVHEGDLWKLVKIDGTFICSTPQERWAIMFGKMFVQIDNRTPQ